MFTHPTRIPPFEVFCHIVIPLVAGRAKCSGVTGRSSSLASGKKIRLLLVTTRSAAQPYLRLLLPATSGCEHSPTRPELQPGCATISIPSTVSNISQGRWCMAPRFVMCTPYLLHVDLSLRLAASLVRSFAGSTIYGAGHEHRHPPNVAIILKCEHSLHQDSRSDHDASPANQLAGTLEGLMHAHVSTMRAECAVASSL